MLSGDGKVGERVSGVELERGIHGDERGVGDGRCWNWRRAILHNFIGHEGRAVWGAFC